MLEIVAIFRFLSVIRINVLQNKLVFFSFFGKRTEVLISDIVKIETEKVVRQSKAGNITDGFNYSILLLKNGKSLEISPDEFENYNEIMVAIISRRNSRNFS